ncbi:hypothetical protein BURPS305_5868 [Burkholderia pseudomallei 305]|nr:hypothetical protein BURPS305_5868 [Burkholderia pseudomallei 305]
MRIVRFFCFMGVSIYRFGIVYWGFRNLLIDLFVMNLIGRDCDGAVC